MSTGCAGCMYTELVASIRKEFPAFAIVRKEDSLFMRLINFALWCLTFGLQSTFMTRYITTVGCKVYVPANWYDQTDVARSIVLRHERVHMRQRRALTMPLYAFLYLLFPLPGVLAYFRAMFEMEAYEETIRATVELAPMGAEIVKLPKYKAQMIANFTGPGYCWMWPFKGRLERWYDAAVARALANQPAE